MVSLVEGGNLGREDIMAWQVWNVGKGNWSSSRTVAEKDDGWKGRGRNNPNTPKYANPIRSVT